MGERSRLRKVKIDIDWQVIDARADSFMLKRHPFIVDILGEFVGCPFFFTIGEIKITNRVTIEGSLVLFNHGVMAIDPHRGMIVRDGKGEDLSVQLFLTLRSLIELDKSSYGNGHTVRVLAIGNIESGSAALHLAGEKGEIHPRCSHEIGNNLGARPTHKWFQLIQLFLGECGSPESHGKVGLWTSFMQREREYAVPAFISCFVEMIEVGGAVGRQCLGRRNNQQTDISNDHGLISVLYFPASFVEQIIAK